MHHKALTRRELLLFMGEEGNERYLRLVLKKQFELKIRNKKGSCYYNKALPFEAWFIDKKQYFEQIDKRNG